MWSRAIRVSKRWESEQKSEWHKKEKMMMMMEEGRGSDPAVRITGEESNSWRTFHLEDRESLVHASTSNQQIVKLPIAC